MKDALDKYCVVCGDEVIRINPRLVARQQISDEVLEQIKGTHVQRLHIFQQARETDDQAQLRQLAKDFEQLEYHQQTLWGFSQDPNFHRWFDFPKCTCPKMDNQDRYGTPYRVISADCPVHGTV
jgi:hypothetical protein